MSHRGPELLGERRSFIGLRPSRLAEADHRRARTVGGVEVFALEGCIEGAIAMPALAGAKTEAGGPRRGRPTHVKTRALRRTSGSQN